MRRQTCCGGVDLNWFKEVWQYGSDLGEADEDPGYLQDGVAPQCKVPGIDNLQSGTKGGRVFIPKSFPIKGFLESHTVKNYDWIFKKGSNDPGYVKPRTN